MGTSQPKQDVDAPLYGIHCACLLHRQAWLDRLANMGTGFNRQQLKNSQKATPEKMKVISEWAVEYDLWKKRRDDVIARLKGHAAQGAQVYIASSVIEPFIEAFAARIGAQTIGTPAEYTNGYVRVAGNLVASERKIEQVLNRLGVNRADFAYGDTEQDIPLLEHTNHPVAVYPNAKLKSVAFEHGWEMIGDTPIY